MTIFEKAKQIAQNGMNKDQVFKFFDKTNKDVIEYITLFEVFGITQNVVWDFYEDWQEA